MLWQTATSIQITAEHWCLLQTLRPHQPARKSFPDLCAVVHTNTNRKVRWCSGLWPGGERCPLLALTVLLTCGTLGKWIHLSGEVFTRRKNNLVTTAPNVYTQTLEASASFHNWEMPMNSFTPLSADCGYNTAFCCVTTTNSQWSATIRMHTTPASAVELM